MADNKHKSCFFVFAFIISLAGYASAGVCPQYDLNNDCAVDINDIDIFVHQWLNFEECEGEEACANFDGLNGVNFVDFSYLAGEWQVVGIPLVINEFLASNNNDSGISDPNGDFDDWIEIYNSGSAPINLAGMYLTDDLSNPTKWQFPAGHPAQTTVPAGGFVVIWADEEPEEGPLHTSFKLSAGGEDIGLFNTDGITLIDSITFDDQETNISYGRYPDATDNLRFFSLLTPAADNNGAYMGEVDNVEFSYERGFYDTGFTLTMACEMSSADIYYTTDGSSPISGESPASGSTAYTTPINISSSTPIRAAAIKTGWMPSAVETHTYIIGATTAQKSLPAMVIVGDLEQSLFTPNGIMAYPTGIGIAYERPVSVEIFNTALDSNYQGDCGIRVQGSDYHRQRYVTSNLYADWTGDYNYKKFSFKFYFRDDYGLGRFEYPLFPLSEIDRCDSIVIRGGHNDASNPFIRDELARRLHRDMGAAEGTGAVVNLFINGVYKVYYNPCERIDKEFPQEWFGSAEEWDVITQNGVRDGDDIAWNAMLDYVRNNDLSNNANYIQAGTLVDIENFIDYLIVVLYSANSDWPNNNWTAAAERSDEGKFIFFVWDTELAMKYDVINKVGFNTFPSWASGGGTGLNGEQTPLAWIYRGLKANNEFKQHFADRIHRHFNNGGAMTNEHMLARFYELRDEMLQVIPGMDTYIADTFIPQRRGILFNAFATEGLLGPCAAPVFNVNGSYKHGGYVSSSDTFTITDPCSTGGTIYYTLDGSDPRMPFSGGTSEPTTVLFAADNAAQKALVPGSDIGTTWRGASEPYNDSGWTSGTGGVGYERGTGYDPYIGIDVETAMYNINRTCYIRVPFNVSEGDLANMVSLTLKMRYDDGFVAYINGTEVKRVNLQGTTPTWNSYASADREATSAFESFDISTYISTLHTGTNILAIHGLNRNLTSSDFLISSELEAAVASGGDEPNLSPGAIQYTGGFAMNNSTNLRSRILKSTGEWSPLNEAVYSFTNVSPNLRITELMYNPQDTGEPNDEDNEYIELKNIGGSAINLNLVSFDKGLTFTFGPNTLAAGQHILVVKDINAFTTKYGAGRYIAGQYTGSLDNGGERIRLLDAIGTPIQDFKYKDGWRSIADGGGYSLTIINPANPDINSWNYNDNWRASAYVNGSPGWDDSGIVPNPGAIAINEIMSHSHAEAPDWIELYNTTASPVNIGGWYLSDSDNELMKYRFAAGTVISANGYIVVREDVNFGDTATDPGRLVPFALSENGEFVRLTSALDANSLLTGYREKEDFGASETGVSFGRHYKASTDSYNFVAMEVNTPGYANSYPKVGPIVITEIMYHPDWPAGGNYANDDYEFVELYNPGGTPVALFDYDKNAPWKFTGGIDFTFPQEPDEVIIPPAGRILIVKNPDAFDWRYPSVSVPVYGPYDGKLANEGEQLELGKPGEIVSGKRQYIRVERVNYSDGSHPDDDPTDQWPNQADGQGKSLTRTSNAQYGNDPNNWTAATPTPGL